MYSNDALPEKKSSSSCEHLAERARDEQGARPQSTMHATLPMHLFLTRSLMARIAAPIYFDS